MTAPAQAHAPATLAAKLDAIAGTPELALHADELRRLARSVGSGDGLAEWAGIDLVGTFARADLLTDPHADQDRGNQQLTARSVLAFVPVMITWFGLVMATDAYQRLIARPDAEERIGTKSFLLLWQQGFDGELWGPLHFSWVGVYTLIALITMVILTLRATRLARLRADQRDKARQDLLGKLVPVLIQAQRAAISSSLASPARFGAELSRAAGQLRELIGHSVAAQNDLRAHGAQTRQLTEILDAAVTRMNQTCTELSAATTAAKSAAETGRADGGLTSVFTAAAGDPTSDAVLPDPSVSMRVMSFTSVPGDTVVLATVLGCRCTSKTARMALSTCSSSSGLARPRRSRYAEAPPLVRAPHCRTRATVCGSLRTVSRSRCISPHGTSSPDRGEHDVLTGRCSSSLLWLPV